MRVLVAGASGTIGRPLTRQLVAAGHEVHGMTRSPGKAPQLERLGATPVVADALDRRAVREAVKAAAPEVVVHQLTALPEAPTRLSHMRATNVLRTQGTDNLVDAALACGVRRIVAQSIVFVYGFRDHGPEPIGESRPAEIGGRFDSVLAPVRHVEERMLGTDGLEGIALRYGLFYSSDWLDRRFPFLPGGGHGVCSFVHIEDAAQATVLAVEDGQPGRAYNVVDDEPVEWSRLMGEIARRTGSSPPRSVPLWLGGLAAPYGAQLVGRIRLGASNRRAREELGWAPRHPTYREGLSDREPALAG